MDRDGPTTRVEGLEALAGQTAGVKALDWLFRDRRTGRVVIIQWPNVPLAVWLAATAVRLALDPTGTWGTPTSVVGTIALATWSIAEIAWGVNPWRRALGTLVLTTQLLPHLP